MSKELKISPSEAISLLREEYMPWREYLSEYKKYVEKYGKPPPKNKRRGFVRNPNDPNSPSKLSIGVGQFQTQLDYPSPPLSVSSSAPRSKPPSESMSRSRLWPSQATSKSSSVLQKKHPVRHHPIEPVSCQISVITLPDKKHS